MLTARRQEGLSTIASEMHAAHFSPADASAIAVWLNVLPTHEARLLAGVNWLSTTIFDFCLARSCTCAVCQKPENPIKRGLLDLFFSEE